MSVSDNNGCRELYTGQQPWMRNPDGTFKANPRNGYLDFTCPAVFRALHNACQDRNPAKRPTFEKIVRELEAMLCAWIRGNDDLVVTSSEVAEWR